MDCYYIKSNFEILSNNNINKYGTASLIKNEFEPLNIKYDTEGRVIKFDINNTTMCNVYIPSGTDSITR